MPTPRPAAPQLDRLVGTQVGVGSVEIRFPILNPSFGLPGGGPADRGRAVLRHRARVGRPSTLKWSRESGDDPVRVRTPLQTFGVSVRTNLFGFAIARLDYSFPAGSPGGQGALDVQPGTDVLGGDVIPSDGEG